MHQCNWIDFCRASNVTSQLHRCPLERGRIFMFGGVKQMVALLRIRIKQLEVKTLCKYFMLSSSSSSFPLHRGWIFPVEIQTMQLWGYIWGKMKPTYRIIHKEGVVYFFFSTWLPCLFLHRLAFRGPATGIFIAGFLPGGKWKPVWRLLRIHPNKGSCPCPGSSKSLLQPFPERRAAWTSCTAASERLVGPVHHIIHVRTWRAVPRHKRRHLSARFKSERWCLLLRSWFILRANFCIK